MGRIRQILKKMFMEAFHRFPPFTDSNFRLENAKKVLFVLSYKRIGDLVVFSFFPREFKKFFPDKELCVAIEGNYAEILEGNPFCRVIAIPDGFFKWLAFLRKEKFDVIIDFPGGVGHNRQLAYYFSGAKAVVLEETSEYHYPYARYVKTDLFNHITSSYKKILLLFANDLNRQAIEQKTDLSYRVEKYDYRSKKHSSVKPLLVINPEGHTDVKTLSCDKVANIARCIVNNTDCSIDILAYKKKYNPSDSERIRYVYLNNFDDLFRSVYEADYVLTVDTASMHIAEMYGRPMTSLHKVILPKNAEIDENSVPKCGKFISKDICDKCAMCQWYPRKNADILIGRDSQEYISDDRITRSVIDGMSKNGII